MSLYLTFLLSLFYNENSLLIVQTNIKYIYLKNQIK